MDVKILIVDDEESLTYSLRQTLLVELPGSQVDVACSGEEGLSHMAGRSYNLIIADLRMPGFDGLDLIRGVRYLDASVPIILMTGYGSEAIQEEASRLGVNCYFDKPFNPGDLLSAVHQLLSHRQEAGG